MDFLHKTQWDTYGLLLSLLPAAAYFAAVAVAELCQFMWKLCFAEFFRAQEQGPKNKISVFQVSVRVIELLATGAALHAALYAFRVFAPSPLPISSGEEANVTFVHPISFATIESICDTSHESTHVGCFEVLLLINALAKTFFLTTASASITLGVVLGMPQHCMRFFAATRALSVFCGVLAIDTIQYVLHTEYHHLKWHFPAAFAAIHQAHHDVHKPYAMSALYNSRLEALLTGSVTLMFFVFGLFRFEEFIFVCALAYFKTALDHGFESSLHFLHHKYGHGNFQQPFFHFFDKVNGTFIKAERAFVSEETDDEAQKPVDHAD